MCGNFGLLQFIPSNNKNVQNNLLQAASGSNLDDSNSAEFKKPVTTPDELEKSLHRSMHEVSSLHGLRVRGDPNWTHNLSHDGKYDVVEEPRADASPLPLLQILQTQISATEIRGGQAGGISCIEFQKSSGSARSHFDSKFGPQNETTMINKRVRCVARKRYPLAADLVNLYLQNASVPLLTSTVTIVGHTRFATSSVNKVPELHPHEWVPFHESTIWGLNQSTGRFERNLCNVGIHISHNGDFDALEMYSQTVVNGDIGLWLERVLHTPNDTKGDSPKIAGCMDLFRVQGRWGPAARLAYIRCILKSLTDVTGGENLSKTAPNHFPTPDIWYFWENFFESIWIQHIGNIILVHSFINGNYHYSISAPSEKQFIKAVCNEIRSRTDLPLSSSWTPSETLAFVYHTVRGFLRSDLYTSMTELLSKAEGSFGLQAHCSLEPGVVILASKGQPMSLAFDPKYPLCLYGSEAEAVAVPIDASGRWLPQRFDLDSHGEIVRVGAPRALTEGSFIGSRKSPNNMYRKPKKGKLIKPLQNQLTLLLDCGVEIRGYSLVTDCELTPQQLIMRSMDIMAAPIPYDPKVDLVAADLAVIPATLAQIDKAWNDNTSIEYHTAQELCQRLIGCMQDRVKLNADNIDLLIGGVEASLWVAEQWAADMRTLFPYLNIVATSANKILSLDMDSPDTIYFPGSQLYPRSHFSTTTCVLLISQSGQTFPTLHATRKVADIVNDRLWLLTGCFQSKMELALIDSYHARGAVYGKNRVFNNYSGNRPAEPTSVAIAATHHSLTYLLLHLLKATKQSQLQLHKDNQLIPTSKSFPRLMTLPSECEKDLEALLTKAILPGLESIVGFNIYQEPLRHKEREAEGEENVHARLVQQGKAWAEHVREPWRMLVIVGTYIILSVGLGLPIFGLIGDAVLAILQACGVVGAGHLVFSPRSPHIMYTQNVGFTLIGLALQVIDALWFVFMVKSFTWIDRWIAGRPLWARHGKRTLVIVDSPMVHQLTEIFVSKLFSQSYSFCSIDVHGASGLDHFVHRFTHRVSRGLLLAVGRPDGRLCCLAKSECAVLLATKQAVFIQNPAYVGGGTGPDIVTVGHNSYVPNLGVAKHIVLSCGNRSMFVDEVLFEQLSDISHSSDVVRPLLSLLLQGYHRGDKGLQQQLYGEELARSLLAAVEKPPGQDALHALQSLSSKIGKRRVQSEISCDPSSRLAFSSGLDSSTQKVLQRQRPLQQLYEGRVAALERYIAFCVMFHAMAKASSQPWLRAPWDVARSQSNLRVATTACPVAASASGGSESTLEVKQLTRRLCVILRGFEVRF